MTAFALVGSSGEAFKEGIGVYGMLASSSGIIHSLCFFVIGVKIYGYGRKYGYSTQCQFFRDRLDNDFVGLLLFPILVALVIPYLLIGVDVGRIGDRSDDFWGTAGCVSGKRALQRCAAAVAW